MCVCVLKLHYLAHRLCNLYKRQLTSKYVIPILPRTANSQKYCHVHNLLQAITTRQPLNNLHSPYHHVARFHVIQGYTYILPLPRPGEKELFIIAWSQILVRARSKACMRLWKLLLKTYVNDLSHSWRNIIIQNIAYLKYEWLHIYSSSCGFGGLDVACWPLVPKFAGSHPAEAVRIFRAKKSSARLPSEGK